MGPRINAYPDTYIDVGESGNAEERREYFDREIPQLCRELTSRTRIFERP